MVTNVREWILSALLAGVCGTVAMGVGKLETLTQSVIELNQHMAVLAFTVETNRKEIDKQGRKIDRLYERK